MFVSLPRFLRIPLACVLLFVSTVVHVLPLLVLTLVRLIIPVRSCATGLLPYWCISRRAG